MLSVEQVIPFVSHDDPLVRNLALHHLKWVRWPERLTGDFVLRACVDGRPELLRWLADFMPTAEVLAHAIAVLEAGSAEDNLWPFRVIGARPAALLTPDVTAAIRGLDFSAPWMRKQLRLRLDILQWPVERVQERFLETCEVSNQSHEAMSSQRETMALAEYLVDHPECHEWAIAQLGRYLRTNDWTETWLFAILANTRWKPILDLAIERFIEVDFDSNESLLARSADCIGELAGTEDLSRLERLWAQGTKAHRCRLVAIVSRLRVPGAEPLLLRLARGSDDPADETLAAEGLCEMLCADADSREFVRGLTDREAFDVVSCDLEELAIPLGIIGGEPFVEEPAWRERLGSPGSRNELRSASSVRGFPGRTGGDMISQWTEAERARKIAPLRKLVSAASPVVKSAVVAKRAGRNDPCPCGSGKKYKKCCLNAETTSPPVAPRQ